MIGWMAGLVCLGATALPPRSQFLQHAEVSAVTLAPSGERWAWLAEEGTRRALWLQALDAPAPRRLMVHTSARELAFTRDGRWLLLAGPGQIHALALEGQAGSGLLAKLPERSEWRVDPSQDAALILTAADDPRATRWRVQRLAVGAPPVTLHEDDRRITGHALDAQGRLRWLQRLEDQALVLRLTDTGEALLHCPGLVRCTPLAEVGGALWLRTDSPIGDPAGLARIVKLGEGGFSTVARDPLGEADLDFIESDASGRPRIAGYRSTRAQIAAIDPRDHAAVAHLQRSFPDSALRPQVGTARWLVEERPLDQPFARWHSYDPRTGELRLVLQERAGTARPGLRPEAHAWTASDGMRLHGFLLRPAGDPRGMPLVVLAHGGPWSHWQPGYHPLAQFIASRGAIVFAPNHRGSTGHGQAYLRAARGDFGHGRVQQDIDDGVRALLAAGIGDPQRVALVGASFGGYVALQGVTHSPELYRMAVAFVPPPDFAWTLRWVLRNAESLALERYVPMADWLRMLDLDVADPAQMARLSAQSPLANVAQLRRPVLVVAGGADQRVGIAGVIEYAARARLSGKSLALLIDPNAGHRQRDDTAREAHLFLIEQMLHQHLQLAEPAPADPAVDDYLKRHFRPAP